jgi:hypothetical protein
MNQEFHKYDIHFHRFRSSGTQRLILKSEMSASSSQPYLEAESWSSVPRYAESLGDQPKS